jgi:dTDP-4-amino-4,6-dideoxygalactose transaminase
MTLVRSEQDRPALLGGSAIRPQGPPDWPCPDPEIQAAILRAFADNSWGKYCSGHVEQLEHALCQHLHVSHALTCASGTLAVEVALRTLGVTAADEVILAGYDYPGNFLSVHALSAKPVLVDILPDSWQLDPAQLAHAFTPKTKAVIASHLHGGRVDIAEVIRQCSSRGVGVIEDTAQCPGLAITGDIGIVSFGGSKLLSAGRGGALLTSRADLAQRAKLHLSRGNNLLAPICELQAITLLPQLAKLAQRNQQRLAAVIQLRQQLADIPGLWLLPDDAGYYKVGFQFSPEMFGLSRQLLTRAMRAEGIALDEGFRALHVGRSPSRYRASGPLTETMRAHEGMAILHHPILLEAATGVEQIVAAFAKVHHHRKSIGEIANAGN